MGVLEEEEKEERVPTQVYLLMKNLIMIEELNRKKRKRRKRKIVQRGVIVFNWEILPGGNIICFRVVNVSDWDMSFSAQTLRLLIEYDYCS